MMLHRGRLHIVSLYFEELVNYSQLYFALMILFERKTTVNSKTKFKSSITTVSKLSRINIFLIYRVSCDTKKIDTLSNTSIHAVLRIRIGSDLFGRMRILILVLTNGSTQSTVSQLFWFM
jgi:hypothetical protein